MTDPAVFASAAYDMAVASTGEKDNGQPRISYPGKGKGDLGTMDCQAFVEACLKKAGLSRNWPGSNAMWRDMAWRGTPEECMQQFGRVPAGAWLFIVTTDMTGVKAKYLSDELGNATHVGICTGKGKGAAHSSSSRGGVCQSVFKGKTIPNGGWNRVGLPEFMDFGLENTGNTGSVMESGTEAFVNADNVKLRMRPDSRSGWHLKVQRGEAVTVLGTVEGTWSRVRYGPHTGYMMSSFLSVDVPGNQGTKEDRKGGESVEMEVYADNGGKVKFRHSASESAGWYDRLSPGTKVTVLENGGKWCKVSFGGHTGYMMAQFLRPAGDEVTLEGNAVADSGGSVTLESLAARVSALEAWRKDMEGHG